MTEELSCREAFNLGRKYPELFLDYSKNGTLKDDMYDINLSIALYNDNFVAYLLQTLGISGKECIKIRNHVYAMPSTEEGYESVPRTDLRYLSYYTFCESMRVSNGMHGMIVKWEKSSNGNTFFHTFACKMNGHKEMDYVIKKFNEYTE